MDTLRLLREQLDELLGTQPLVVRELAQLILQIPQIIDSQVYGLVLRNPQAFLSFLRAQLRPAGYDLPTEGSSDSNLIAQVNELRTFTYIHLHRLGLQNDPEYFVFLHHTQGFALPGEFHDLAFANEFLEVAEILLPSGQTVPNNSNNLVPFARAVLSAAGRAQPGFSQLLRTTRYAGLAFAWFVISLYVGFPDNADFSFLLPQAAADADQAQAFRCTARTLAALIAGGLLGDIGGVIRQFRREPRVLIRTFLSLPSHLEVCPRDLWDTMALHDQDTVFILGTSIRLTNQQLWYRICRLPNAFLVYCHQLLHNNFDASAFQTPDATDLISELMYFILADITLQQAIEGIRFLLNAPEMQPLDARNTNARLFLQWQSDGNPDDDVDIITQNMLSNELLEMALSSRSIDIGLLSTQQLSAGPAAEQPFPGFQSAGTSDAAVDDDFDGVCLFCITRLCDPAHGDGEPVYILPCCRARIGAVCLKAFNKSSSLCPFCSQCMEM